MRRLLAHLLVALALLVVSLAIGMCGYVYYENLSWTKAFLDAAMPLGGMGPVDPPQSDPGRIFAGIYALYAGLVFIVDRRPGVYSYPASRLAQVSLGRQTLAIKTSLFLLLPSPLEA